MRYVALKHVARLVLWGLFALTLGCPAEPPKQQGLSANAQRTLDVERGQITRRLESLQGLPKGKPGLPGEETAIQDLRVWLTQRRQWRAESYRVEVRTTGEQGALLDRAGLEAIVKSEAPVELVISVPDFTDPTPSAKRTFETPTVLEPLVDLLPEPAPKK